MERVKHDKAIARHLAMQRMPKEWMSYHVNCFYTNSTAIFIKIFTNLPISAIASLLVKLNSRMSTSSALGSFPCGKLPPFTGLSGLAQVLRPILNGMFPGPPATKSELVCTVCANWIMVWDRHKSHTDPFFSSSSRRWFSF